MLNTGKGGASTIGSTGGGKRQSSSGEVTLFDYDSAYTGIPNPGDKDRPSPEPRQAVSLTIAEVVNFQPIRPALQIGDPDLCSDAAALKPTRFRRTAAG